MLKIISLFYSIAWAAKEKAVVVTAASTENADYALAFKSIGEFQNTIYGAAAFFVGRELWSWWKDKNNKTSERLDRIEKLVDRLMIIAEYEEKRQAKK
jgi:hypothetical protein